MNNSVYIPVRTHIIKGYAEAGFRPEPGMKGGSRVSSSGTGLDGIGYDNHR